MGMRRVEKIEYVLESFFASVYWVEASTNHAVASAYRVAAERYQHAYFLLLERQYQSANIVRAQARRQFAIAEAMRQGAGKTLDVLVA